MKKVIVITGTPGTGKTTISNKLARALRGSELINANEIVRRKKLFTSRAKDGTMIVKMSRLSSEINRMVKSSKSGFVIVEGHLLCEIKVDNATAIVIREHLDTLLERLKKRGYSRQKIEDNIVSEGTDYCGVRAADHYKNVYEILGGNGAVKKAMDIATGKKIKAQDVEMLEELNGLLTKLK